MSGSGPPRSAVSSASTAAIDFLRSQFEVEDVEVLRDAVRPDQLGDGAQPVLEVPAQHHLGRRLAVLVGQLDDG
jgi:hypothetical protein